MPTHWTKEVPQTLTSLRTLPCPAPTSGRPRLLPRRDVNVETDVERQHKVSCANASMPAERIDETATMAAAKLVSDAIHSSNAMALRQLQDLTQLLVAAMNMAAMQAGLRHQMASPPIPHAGPATTSPPAPPADASDANMSGSEDVAEQHEP
ncbi:unnamed protein product [Closterium sp. NIES-54]